MLTMKVLKQTPIIGYTEYSVAIRNWVLNDIINRVCQIYLVVISWSKWIRFWIASSLSLLPKCLTARWTHVVDSQAPLTRTAALIHTARRGVPVILIIVKLALIILATDLPLPLIGHSIIHGEALLLLILI